jgi:hypothetical protein
MSAPKTITLYGRGKRRYPIVPGVWAHCIEEAKQSKTWAAQRKNDRRWKAQACRMSLDSLASILASTVEELAKRSYRYLEMRAHLGNPQCWDRPARELWVKLGGRIRRPQKKVAKKIPAAA